MATKMRDPNTVITPRQLELIALYASGDEINDIAGKKFLSPSTVKREFASARKRVGARTLAHLCVILLDAGLLSQDKNGYIPIQEERIIG